METPEILNSETLKRQSLQLSQLELMIEYGNIEYQVMYDRLEKEIIPLTVLSIMLAKQELESTLCAKNHGMSNIEIDIYNKSITKLETIRKNWYTDNSKAKVMR